MNATGWMALVGWGLAVLAAAVIVLAWTRSRLNWEARRRRVALTMRLGLLALALLAVSEPTLPRWGERPWITVLVERGERVDDAAAGVWAAWRDRAGATPGDVDVREFGAVADGEPESTSEAPDLRAAWREAELARPAGRTGPVLIFTGGRGPAPSVADWAAARAAGRTISVVPVAAPERPDVAVTAIRAPTRLRPGDPFVWEVELTATGGIAEAEVRIERGDLREVPRRVTFTGGRARLEVADRAGEEALRRLAVTVVAEGDTRPANDRRELTRPVAAAGRVRWVTDRPDQAAPMVAALRAEGLLLDVSPPEALPPRPDHWPAGTVLVLDNIPATLIPETFQSALGSWLRSGQGGLLVLGGDRSLGPGGYRDSALGNWLPVEPRFERDEERPVVALVLALDRSGSMTGEKLALARAAAVAAAEALSPRDLVGVITFDTEATWTYEPAPAADRAGLRARLETVTAGGGTAISPALARALERLPSLPAARRHLLLLTDGISQAGPMLEQVRNLVSAGVTVSTVGAGNDADRTLLELLAREGGGRFYFTPDPRQVPQIFTRETELLAQTGFREEPVAVKAGRRARWLEAAGGGQAPRLRGYTLSSPRDGAEVWLWTETGDPLLAGWRVGLGRAVVWTSDARARWATEWLAWDRFGPFWAGVLRHVEPPRGGAVEHLDAEPVPGGWTLAWEPGDTLADEQPVAVWVTSPDGREARVPLLPTEPGRWEAAGAGAQPGRWQIDAVVAGPDGTERRQPAAAWTLPPAGADAGPPDLARLADWVGAGGGVLDPADWAELPAPADGWKQDTRWRLAPWLWALALAWLVADLWWRRRPAKVRLPRSGVAAASKTNPKQPRGVA